MTLASLSPATAPLVVAAALLASAGAAKLRRPAPTGLALARVGLPGSDGAVRALGAVELVVAAAAVALGGPVAAAVAVLYAGFAAFTTVQVARARRTGVAADCGCFGSDGAPVDATHVTVNVALAAGASWAAVAPADGVAGWADAPLAAAVTVVLALVAAVGTRAVLTELATVRALVALEPPS